ncbi:recombination-associated protein RdgC [Methylovulum psychrotolerans]|uniref:Recombination-associated protein RdgC n=1 Tax=Methylovulum psychrotolerans TaxID=1704499 RepID=A0A1Z4BTV9_9GAMM|nr:recombination-associated protein RdgC [Methylovulum psychrotolerans]ASF44672.1 recombination-associated protein RdgC [Methylovulum psychrotolerans]POZ52629.1 recombination-associated protein RdgC [Methylovulum psychrotolerans]
MWFKNLSIFRLTEAFTLSSEELEQKLEALAFRPCGPHEEFAFGWTAPLGKSGQQLVHSSNGFMMLCGKKEERVLPASVVNELLQEKISDAEDKQGRKLSKKDRTTIKDELIFELLPKAFTFSRKTYAYIDPQGGWVIVDAASAKAAEDLLSLLRKCLGSLPAVPLNTVNKPTAVLTEWLSSQQTPDDLTVEDECELRSPEEAGGIIRCKRHDLALPEIKNHLDTGKQVIKLAVNWADRLAFIVDEHLAIKRLRFLDLVQDQAADVQADNEAERFDADFAIMSLELGQFLPRLVELFGGEQAG